MATRTRSTGTFGAEALPESQFSAGQRLRETRAGSAWTLTALKGTLFVGVNLNSAKLGYTDLSGANLSYATSVGTDFTSANLIGAKITSANMTGATSASSSNAAASVSPGRASTPSS